MSTEAVPAAAAGVRKFMFDRSFDDASIKAAAAPERRPVPYTQDQIDAIKKEAQDAGFATGKMAGIDEMAQKLNVTVEQIGVTIARLLETGEAARQKQEGRIREAVLAIARKVLPDFNQKHGLQEIEAVVSGVIGEMASEPRLVVRVNEAQFDAVDAALKTTTEKQGYAGKIVLLADATVAANDCRVEWADGGVERNLEALYQNLGKTLTPGQEQPQVTSDAAG